MNNMTTKEKIKVEIFHANTGIKYGFFDGQFFWSGCDESFIDAMKDEMAYNEPKLTQYDIELIERWQTTIKVNIKSNYNNINFMRNHFSLGRQAILVRN